MSYAETLDDPDVDLEQVVTAVAETAGHMLSEREDDLDEPMLCECGVRSSVFDFLVHRKEVALAQLVADGHMTETAARVLIVLDERAEEWCSWVELRETAVAVAAGIDEPAVRG